MATYPVGLDRMLDPETGQVIGTQPVDMQRWIWSLYRADTATIARGLEVSGTSSMSYRVEGGVAIIPMGDQRAIAVPVDAVYVQTAEAPSTGTRTEVIYLDRDDWAVKIGAVQPAGTVLLDRRNVPAGISATTATTSTLGNRKYAPLFGSSMGRIAAWHESVADLGVIPRDRTLCAAFTFTLDSDRRLSFTLQQSYDLDRPANQNGATDWKVASMLWEYEIDGVKRLSLELGVESFAETKQNSYEFDMTAGTHTVRVYRRRRLIGLPDDVVVHRKGGSSSWPGTSFKINDMGGIA